MAGKHGITILNCVIAVIVVRLGMITASLVAERQPVAGFVVLLAAIVMPVLIATRVAWASGYTVGRRDATGQDRRF